MEVARRSWPIRAPRTPGGPRATRTGARSLSAARQGPGRRGRRETWAPPRAPGLGVRTPRAPAARWESPPGGDGLKRIHRVRGGAGAGGALRARGKQAGSVPETDATGWKEVTGFVQAAPGGDRDGARGRGFLRTRGALRLRAGLGSSFSASPQSMVGRGSKGTPAWGQRAKPRCRRLAVPRAPGCADISLNPAGRWGRCRDLGRVPLAFQ